MAATIGSLRAEMEAEVARFKEDMGKAAAAVENFQRRANRAGNQLDRYNRRVRETENRMDSLARNVQRNTQAFGTFWTAGVTVPVALAGAAVVRTAGDFEQSMNRVAAVTSATGDDFDRLRASAREMGATTVFSASESAEALTFLAMAGFDVDQSIGALPATLSAAAAGQLELGRAADLVSNVLTGYRLEIDQTDRAVDVLVATANSANTNVEQLATAFRTAGPVAAAAGLDFEETAATLGVLANAGFQAQRGGTAMKIAIQRLNSEVPQVQESLREYGIIVHDANGEMLDFADIVQQLQNQDLSIGELGRIFGEEAGPSMAAVVGQGADAIRELQGELRNAGGTAERVANRQMEGFNGQMRELRSAAEELAITIADSGLLEGLTEFARQITTILRQLSETNPEVLDFAVKAAGVLAILGPMALAMSVVIRMVRAAAVVVPILTQALAAFRVGMAASALTMAGFTARLLSFYAAWEAGQFIGNSRPAQGLAEDLAAALARLTLTREHGEEAVEAAIANMREENRRRREGVDVTEAQAQAEEELAEATAALGESAGYSAEEFQAMLDEIAGTGDAAAITDAELAQLRATLMPVTVAVEQYTRNLAAATAQGWDTARATRALAEEAVTAAGGWEAVLEATGAVPAAIRRVAEGMRDIEQQADVEDLTGQFERLQTQIDRVALAALAPLDRELGQVDLQYGRLTETIREQMAEAEALAGTNQRAGAIYRALITQLAQVESAHQQAREAAIAQRQAIESVEAAFANIDTTGVSQDIEDLRQARGDFGTLTASVSEMIGLERDLTDTRLRAIADLRRMEADLVVARQQGDDAQVLRLERLITMQREYADVALNTTASQIQAQRRLQDLIGAFEQTTQSAITDLLVGITTATDDFDWRDWAKKFSANLYRALQEAWSDRITTAIFDRLGIGNREQNVQTINAGQIIAAGGASEGAGGTRGILGQIGDVIGGWFGRGQGAGAGGGVKAAGSAAAQTGTLGGFGNLVSSFAGLFGGFFEDGGHLARGKWGIVGENGPEMAFGGRSGMDVRPMEETGPMGSGDVNQNFYISTPDPDGFRRSERQIGQMARRRFT